jgi:hypothetical protein
VAAAVRPMDGRTRFRLIAWRDARQSLPGYRELAA